MGEVWVAEQEKPVRRRVALKLIRLGMDSKEVLARFESERQALALMSHPSIAAIYDAGVTERGRSYFAMEYVKGEPITDYCDRHRLRPRERLVLFCQVCDAVQHAHQKGIIHRDLKPSNVMVTVQENRPLPKIIDFGVAKATAQRLTEKTVLTEYGQLIGTPEYMSPEQAEMTGLDIDTRTDVYSLGALLYELLTGLPPFDSKELRSAGFGEIQRRIRDDQPLRPSTRLSRLGEISTTVAERRQVSSGALVKRLRGDLDWIVMKAMEKDRTRRYASASGLAMDVGRHLRHEPVVAGPPSTAYRAAKFVRRHRLGVAAAVLVALALVGGTVGTALGLVRAREAEQLAKAEVEIARRVSDFLVELFEVSDPSEARGNEITAREILDRGAERIESELSEQPVIEARLLHTVGRVYGSLGLFRPAEPLLEKAVELHETSLGPQHPDLARSLDELGADKTRLGKLDEAETLLQRALQIRQSVRDPNDAEIAEIAETLLNLSAVFREQGRLEEAETIFDSLVPLQEERLGPEHPELAQTLDGLATIYHDQADFTAFEPVAERVLQIREAALEVDHPEIAASLHRLGDAYMHRGRLEESEAAFGKALAIREKVLGPEHPHTLFSLAMLSNVVGNDSNRLDEALLLKEELVSIAERSLGSEHYYLGNFLTGLGHLHSQKGNFADAVELTERALSIMEQSLGPDNPQLALLLNNLAQYFRKLGRPAEADPLLRRVLRMEADLGPEHSEILRSLATQADLRRDQGDLAAAEPLYERVIRSIEGLSERSPDTNITFGQVLHGLGLIRQRQDPGEEALALLQRALEVREEALGTDATATQQSRRAITALRDELAQSEKT